VSDRYGALAIDGDRAVITFVRHLPYPIEAVWSAIADPDQRACWFGETTLDGRVGGSIEMVPEPPPVPVHQKRMTGRILVWDPPRVLEHEWNQAIVPESVVRYELTPVGAGTMLHFSHTGLRVSTARGFMPGTHAFLDRLESHLAATSLPDWSTRYREVAASYPARP
jgi:uncharacterized protein YndB with AHSA1/START domain